MTLDDLELWLAQQFHAIDHPEPDLVQFSDAASIVRELAEHAARLGLSTLHDRCRVGAFLSPWKAKGILSDAVRHVRRTIHDEAQSSANAPRREWFTVADIAELTGRQPAEVCDDFRARVVDAYKAPGGSYWRLDGPDARTYLELWRADRLECRPRRRGGGQ